MGQASIATGLSGRRGITKPSTLTDQPRDGQSWLATTLKHNIRSQCEASDLPRDRKRRYYRHNKCWAMASIWRLDLCSNARSNGQQPRSRNNDHSCGGQNSDGAQSSSAFGKASSSSSFWDRFTWEHTEPWLKLLHRATKVYMSEVRLAP